MYEMIFSGYETTRRNIDTYFLNASKCKNKECKRNYIINCIIEVEKMIMIMSFAEIYIKECFYPKLKKEMDALEQLSAYLKFDMLNECF